MVFGDFPVLESVNLVLRKIEEVHLQELYSIYDNDKVFEYCGIIPKHNLQTVRKMIGHFDRDYHKKAELNGVSFRRIKVINWLELLNLWILIKSEHGIYWILFGRGLLG